MIGDSEIKLVKSCHGELNLIKIKAIPMTIGMASILFDRAAYFEATILMSSKNSLESMAFSKVHP